MSTKEFLLTIIICIGVYLLYKQRQIYLLKKYPPGSGKIFTTESHFWYQDPKDVNYHRVLRRWTEDNGRLSDGSKHIKYYQECETWE